MFDVEVTAGQAATANDRHRSAASAILEELRVGQPVLLVREPWTPGNESAVAVQTLSGELIGRLVSDSSDMLQVCIVKYEAFSSMKKDGECGDQGRLLPLSPCTIWLAAQVLAVVAGCMRHVRTNTPSSPRSMLAPIHPPSLPPPTANAANNPHTPLGSHAGA